MQQLLQPGDYVRNPHEPDWGIGQVQSSTKERITINFEHSGKQVINASKVILDKIYDLSAEQ